MAKPQVHSNMTLHYVSKLRYSQAYQEGLEALQSNGFIVVKDAVDVDLIRCVRDAIAEILCAQGWADTPADLRPRDPVRRIGSAAFLACVAEIMKLESVHELFELQPLTDLLNRLFRCKVFPHPRKMVRIAYPYDTNRLDLIPPHQDVRYVKGELDTLTAWIPLDFCPPSKGGVRFLPQSHCMGLLPTKPNEEGRFSCTVVDIDDENNYSWSTADYQPGDVVLFHSMTIHGSGKNQTSSFRLSADCRFSAVSGSVHPDELLPPYYPGVPAWDTLNQNWQRPNRFENISAQPNTNDVDPSGIVSRFLMTIRE